MWDILVSKGVRSVHPGGRDNPRFFRFKGVGGLEILDETAAADGAYGTLTSFPSLASPSKLGPNAVATCRPRACGTMSNLRSRHPMTLLLSRFRLLCAQ